MVPNKLGFIACMIAVAATLAACGDGDVSRDRAAPAASDFPVTNGRGLEEILATLEPSDLVVSPAGQVFDSGVNRFSFGVFTVSREQVTDAEVALYFEHRSADEAIGPYPARVVDLSTDPAFVAETTAADPDAAEVAYVVPRVRLDREGEWRVVAVINEGDFPEGARLPSLVVGQFPRVPEVGEKAPLIHTPTADEVANLEDIDTRVPHDTMHEIDYADAYGRRPVVIMFATPALCQSRVCGPVVDVEQQVASEFGDEDVAFIHMEVYVDNNAAEGLRPQLEAFHLPTEPWTFVLDEDGVISSRIEGPVSVEELRQAVRKVL